MKRTRGYSGWYPCSSGGGFRVDLRARAMSLSEDELSTLLQRMAQSLDRVSESVRRVRVRIVDVNADKGGHDKRCSIQVWMRGCGKVEVSGMGESIWQALSNTLAALKRRCHERVARLRRRRGARRQRFLTGPARAVREGVPWPVGEPLAAMG